MLDIAIAAAQLLSLAALLLGFALLSERARVALIDAYTNTALDRIGGRTQAQVRSLAIAISQFLYVGRAGKPSLWKTLAIGASSALLIGVPVAFFLMVFVSGSSAPVDAPDKAVSFRVLVWQYLPMTILFHWASEYSLASILWRSLRTQPPISLSKVALRVASALLVFIALPLLLSRAFLYFESQSAVAHELGTSLLLTGPGVVMVMSTLNLSLFGWMFWLAVASCLTFSSAILVVVYSALMIRSRLFNTLLGKLIGRTGPGSGVLVIAASAAAFGWLTDLASSKPSLAKLLGF